MNAEIQKSGEFYCTEELINGITHHDLVKINTGQITIIINHSVTWHRNS